MATALSAAVSDALDDGRVVSGVGSQYNFVAMAHALADARGVLMFRTLREDGAATQSNVRWNYGHTTIPRHLRDIYIDEYGIADLRGLTDEDCVIAMTGIADAAFQQPCWSLPAGKLARDFQPPVHWQRNRADDLAARLAPFRRDGSLPDYPLGSDFTAIEQDLVRALAWLQQNTRTRGGKLRTLVAVLRHPASDGDASHLLRMGLEPPETLGERLNAGLLRLALARTAKP